MASSLVALHTAHHSVWYGCNVQSQNILCQLIGDAGLSTSPYTPLALNAHYSFSVQVLSSLSIHSGTVMTAEGPIRATLPDLPKLSRT